MTPRAQNIAIAEACGWTLCPEFINAHGDKIRLWRKPGEMTEEGASLHADCELPNYLACLNAIHAAVMAQPAEIQCNIASELDRLVNARLPKFRNSIAGMSAVVSATAAQRSEAFLRVLGKWEEQP